MRGIIDVIAVTITTSTGSTIMDTRAVAMIINVIVVVVIIFS